MFVFYVHKHLSSFPSNFDETDTMFLEFVKDVNNATGGSSSVGDNLESNTRTPDPPTLESPQPLFGDEIYEIVVGRRLSYSKGLGWGLKPKSSKRAIEEQTRKQDMLASEVERIWKFIKDMTQAQQGLTHDT
ncbi:uncharacterized protein E5676_scaffold306G001000 [Cucumis melo var. makuwa]|uniref:CACTA en-spm transposon protein n=1 Tax=Cucumis melo var. makuwa TaxID=1194695 RepID=A0A5A7TGC5_CUCMM|nr:uncharacterized protein E6C27_scaffold67G003140 [Cucumis melo var. makuwa]TYK17840.1 uncharacterized protein E5676_scaffold306G001000 [Cucumis melo var. makuwa]